MSTTGLISLVEMAKNGARFGHLSAQHRDISRIPAEDINLAEADIIEFLTASPHVGLNQDTANKNLYVVNKYSGQYLWLYENFTKNSTMYNIPIAKEIVGHFDPVRFIYAFKKSISQHDALCGRYRLDDENIFVESTAPDLTIYDDCIEDISSLGEMEQDAIITAALKAQCSEAFNLGTDIPARCHIIKRNEKCHALFLTFHHCVVDGWTANLLVDELSQYYQSMEEDKPRSSHAFFRFLEDPFLSINNVESSLAFWRNELRHAPKKHELPYDIAINQTDKTQNILRKALRPELKHALTLIAQRAGTSLFTLFHSAFALLIARESASEQVVIGSPVANRNEQTLNTEPGSFVNTVAYQFHIDAQDSFACLLRKTSEKFASSFRHQGLPFAYLVEQLKPVRGKFHPIFQIMFVCQHRKNNELVFGQAQVSTLQRNYAPPKFDLVLEVISSAEGIQFEWQYNAKLFSPKRIQALAHSYVMLLDNIAFDSTRAVGEYPHALPDDLAHLKKISQGETIPEFLQQNLPAALWQVSKDHASLPALIESHSVWTYTELMQHACMIANWLKNNCISDEIVAIDMPRGALQAIATLGTILAGLTYLPLAEGMPDRRAADIIRLSGCGLILTSQHSSRVAAFGGRHLIIDAAFFAGHPHADFRITPHTPQDLAYIIYTSGTTGTPKGVAIEQESITNTLLSMNHLFAVSPQDNVLAIADLGFDLSVYDLFGSWLAGATVVCLQPDEVREPARWLEIIEQQTITIWNSVPAVLQMLIRYCELKNIGCLPDLRQIWLSGDCVSSSLVSESHRLFPNAVVTSLGGATEGAIWSVYHPVAQNTQYKGAIPYGVALPNQSMWVLDDNYALCGYNEAGDIYIGGAGIAREYWCDRQTTAESFIVRAELGGRLYRTGDRGRWNRCGYIEFLGRKDHQVKIQGFRVELGDVESTLKASELVAEACVLCHSPMGCETPHLEAYITLTPAGHATEQTETRLREHITGTLPTYMAPVKYHFIDRLPLSRNGKLDRLLLSTIAEPRQFNRDLSSPAITAEIWHLQTLLAETLSCAPDQIDPHTNFFANGGSSLSGITFLGKIKHCLSVELTLAEILGYPQLSFLAERTRQNCPSVLSMISGNINHPSLPTLYLVHGAGGQVNQYVGLMRQLAPYANIRTIASPGLAASNGGISFTLQQLAATHLAAIPQDERTSAVIAGWSLGGQLAIHMAALATQQNEPFAHAVIIDSSLPSSATLKKRHCSVVQCYLNLFDSLGITRCLYQYEEIPPKDHFIDEVREHYASNQHVLAGKITVEHAEAFCLSIKTSFELTDCAGALPPIDIPLTLWLSQERQYKQSDLSRRWRAQSSRDVQLTYCARTHYDILDDPQLQQSLAKLLCSLPSPTTESKVDKTHNSDSDISR